ncbi:superoxide dismutase [Bacteroidales bacterium OttesenSCG-928-L03]|nr:superoxide dismutase [Bacteroidales bacterium OttesenSCG-928-L03]
MKLAMPILPYAATALAPVISEQTIGFHWGKHVQAYVNNLNNLVPGTAFENSSLEEIILKADGGVFNNGAQVWNHVFYFNGFSAQRETKPSSSLMTAINEAFGDFDTFRKEFDKQAATIFGSGWMWLVKDRAGKLSLMKKSNAENPMRDGFTPLLVADVWEHAYYLDYQNRRPDHLSALWEIVDWDIISQRYEA